MTANLRVPLNLTAVPTNPNSLVITAVSPNVVVTILLRLRDERLGLNKGIHTLIIAMTSCNDVLAIFLFGVVLSIIFSTGTLTEQLLQGPVGIGIGVVYGGLFGVLLWLVPSNRAVGFCCIIRMILSNQSYLLLNI